MYAGYIFGFVSTSPLFFSYYERPQRQKGPKRSRYQQKCPSHPFGPYCPFGLYRPYHTLSHYPS